MKSKRSPWAYTGGGGGDCYQKVLSVWDLGGGGLQSEFYGNSLETNCCTYDGRKVEDK